MASRSEGYNPLGKQGIIPNGAPIYVYELDYVLSPDDGGLLFFYSKKPVFNDEDPGNVKTQALDIGVETDCWIEIWLTNKPWRWAPEDAVVTSEKQDDKYFLLKYDNNGVWVDRPVSKNCRGIRFGALHQAGPVGDTQPFNLNIDLFYGPDKYLPIAIDPDLRNPGKVP